jgi:hypothetical protein
MRNQLELKWLSFGDAGFQIDFDTKVMGATGLPFSGLGVYGKIQVGKEGESRVSYEAASAIQIKKDEFPGLLWHVQASNIRFDDIIELLMTIARKKEFKEPFPADRIPVMRINTLKGYIATTATIIARRKYKQGFAGTFDMEMFGQKALFDVTILPKTLQMEGVGYLSNIELKNKKGKEVFSLTGPGLDQKYGTKDDGPVAFCSFDAKHPGSGAFGLRGTLEIPPLGLKSKVDFVRSKYKLTADIENKIAGFTTLLQFKVDPLQLKTMFIKIGFKKDFDQFLMGVMKDSLTKFKSKMVVRLDELNKKMTMLSKRVGEFGKKGAKVTGGEIIETEAEIAQLRRTYTELDQKLKEEQPGEEKRKARRERREVGLKLAMKKAYFALALKPGHVLMKGAIGAVEKITKEFADAQLLKKATEKTLNGMTTALDGISKGIRIIQLKEVAGSYSIPEMLEGKSPKLDKFVVITEFPGRNPKEISLENVQFDFKKPARAAGNIIKQIFKSIGFKLKK